MHLNIGFALHKGHVALDNSLVYVRASKANQ